MAFIPQLINRKTYNEDGVGGMHVYSPWWLDNKYLDFARGYHIEVWGGLGAPSYGTGFNVNSFNKFFGINKAGGYGNSLRDDMKKYYGSTIGLSGRGESIAQKQTTVRLILIRLINMVFLCLDLTTSGLIMKLNKQNICRIPLKKLSIIWEQCILRKTWKRC